MGLQIQAVTGQCDVHKGFMIKEVLENRQQVVLVVVPSETIQLGLGYSHPGGGEFKAGLDKLDNFKGMLIFSVTSEYNWVVNVVGLL